MPKAELIVCVGAGGVGKTTVSSMLGFYYARKGLRSLVITIDPAQRLRDALGLKNYVGEPQKVEWQSALLPDLPGELYAFLPDLKHEWQSFLRASIHEAAVIKDISANPFYNYVSEGLPGSLEIICAHIVTRLLDTHKYDVIILDTPPSSQSVAFFDVPKKLSRVLEQSLFRMLIKGRHSLLMKLTKKLAFFSSGLLEKTLEKLMGSHFLSEVMDFAFTIDGLYEPLLARAKAMENLLIDPTTQFILVSRPSTSSLSDAQRLKELFKERGLKISQVIFNQLWPAPLPSLTQELEQIPNLELQDIVNKYLEEYNYQQVLLKRGEQQWRGVDCRRILLSSAMSDLLNDYQNKE